MRRCRSAGPVAGDPRGGHEFAWVCDARVDRREVGGGGFEQLLERIDHYLPVAPVTAPIAPAQSGYLSAVDARAVGNAIIELGGGRRRADDKLDLSVGFTDIVPIGATVDRQRPLAVVHAASDAAAQRAIRNLRGACTIAQAPPAPLD